MSVRPNIVVLVAHDLGTYLGCYGAPVRTPALDALAANGVRLDRHFATAPYCSPSRGSLMTGTYPHTNGLVGNLHLGWALNGDHPTLDVVLAAHGYHTFLIGFQHEAHRVGDLEFGDVAGEWPHHAWSIAGDFERFCAERVPGLDAPFYVRMGVLETHRPFDPALYEPQHVDGLPPYTVDAPGTREDVALFHGAITSLDDAVARIVRALEECGALDNTIVVFAADHGIAYPKGKGTLYDHGIRTALLIRGPAPFTGGSVATDLVSGIDLMPTLLEAAGAQIPPGVQGRSFLPALQGRPYDERAAVFAETDVDAGDAKRCIRTDRFKLIRNLDTAPMSERTCTAIFEWRCTTVDPAVDALGARPPVELYDLETDPLEEVNLADHAEFAHVRRDLERLLDDHLQSTGDPRLAGPYVRPDREAQVLERWFQWLPEQEREFAAARRVTPAP